MNSVGLLSPGGKKVKQRLRAAVVGPHGKQEGLGHGGEVQQGAEQGLLWSGYRAAFSSKQPCWGARPWGVLTLKHSPACKSLGLSSHR